MSKTLVAFFSASGVTKKLAQKLADEIEADKYGDYIIDMKEKADIMLKVYFGLDDASRESFLSSSDIEQTAYLEEVIIHE